MPDAPEPSIDADELGRIADQASLGLIGFDAALRVRHANLAAHHALERRPGTLIGRSLMETFVDHRLEELVRAAARGEIGRRARSARASAPASSSVPARPATAAPG